MAACVDGCDTGMSPIRKTFFCVDGHTCGCPVRLVAGGGPELVGATMSEKRQDFLARFDWIRTALMFEPRGHDVMSGSILYPPTTPDGDVGVLFIEVSGCLPMCGHGTIGTVTMALEQGLVVPKEPGVLRLDTPAGRVVARYEEAGRFVERVRLTNVKSYLALSEVRVDCPELGELVLDVAYGGNFYAIVEPQPNYPGLDEFSAGQILRLSPLLRRAVNEAVEVVHPEDPTIRGVHHIQWTGQAARPARARPQRRVLRRQGDRPQPLRHRHLGADGAARGQGEAEGRRRVRPREHHRQRVRGPGGGGDGAGGAARDRALDRRLGADDRAEHDLRGRARPVLARVSGDLTSGVYEYT